MLKKKKPKSIQRLTTLARKSCVKVAKDIVKHKAGYHCEFVNESGVRCHRKSENGYQMHGSHIKSEGRYPSMSADIDNIQCHCAGHHTGMGNVSPNWHDDPLGMVDLFAKQQPERAKELQMRTLLQNKMGLLEWKVLLADLKEIWSNLIN